MEIHKCTKERLPLKTINGKTAENDLGKAEALNDQFSSVFTKTASDKVPLLQQKYPKMSNIHVTEEEVKKLLPCLNTSKACGPDEISPKILKELSHELAPIIQHLFQQSLDTSYPKSGLLQTSAHYIRKLIDPFQPTIVRCHLLVYYVS